MILEPFLISESIMSGLWLVFGLALATLISEDLTCVTAGLLIGTQGADPWFAMGGCLVGIYLGDCTVFGLGRWAPQTWLGQRLTRTMPDYRNGETARWLVRHGAATAVLSRFLPGTRVPVFFLAGLMGVPATRFLTWAAIAAVLWVPIVVLSIAFFGDAIHSQLLQVFGTAVWVIPALGVFGFLVVKVIPQLFCRTGRCRLTASVARLWHWEFWPAWMFYIPLIPWFVLLAIRYRGATVWTAANPGIPAGGVIVESKFQILSQLLPRWTAATTLIPSGRLEDRVSNAIRAVDSYPVILKPDRGYRGAGVRLVYTPSELEDYLARESQPVLVQTYYPGPFEAGVFYYRIPGESQGHLFSVTTKAFPELIGDGRSTVAELIRAHPRYRMQEHVFFMQHAQSANLVIPLKQRFPLSTIGNHCLGTQFCDGQHLMTPEFESRLMEVLSCFDGFYFGRFDIRYTDPSELIQGRGFAIVELNGVTSESGNVYDPTWSLWRAYATLFRQWHLAFRIGAMNRARGYRATGILDLLGMIRRNSLSRRSIPSRLSPVWPQVPTNHRLPVSPGLS